MWSSLFPSRSLRRKYKHSTLGGLVGYHGNQPPECAACCAEKVEEGTLLVAPEERRVAHVASDAR